MMLVILGIRSHFVTRLPEWFLAAGLMCEGGKLIATDTLHSARSYAVLAQIIDGPLWGALGVLIGLLWMIALALNGTYVPFRRVSPWVRSIAALGATFYWTFIAIGMQLANPASTGRETHGTLAALSVAYAIIVAREVGVLEGEAYRCRQRLKS